MSFPGIVLPAARAVLELSILTVTQTDKSDEFIFNHPPDSNNVTFLMYLVKTRERSGLYASDVTHLLYSSVFTYL